MNVRLLRVPGVLRYAAIFWAFYELFMVFVILSGTRVIMQGSVLHIVIYAYAGGACNLLFTVGLFGVLDELDAWRGRGLGMPGELLVLLLIVALTVLISLAGDAVLRTWADGMPARTFSVYWADLLPAQFHDTLITTAFLMGLGNALRSWASEDARKIRESELKTAIARAELEALAAHLRPAVVSEALREIGTAVECDPAEARALTLRLANSLRASFL